jgi:hypothetical protein
MADESRNTRIDDITFYMHLRSRLEHEDNLVIYRILWLMGSQSLVFTAYAIVMNGPLSSRLHGLMLQLLPMMGIFSSALIFVGIIAAIRAMGWIRGLLRERIPDEARLGLPPLHPPGAVKAGLAAPLLLPPVFILVWFYLLSVA